MEHIIRFEQGHDCIKFECRWGRKDCRPGGGGSHGVSGMSIRFVAKGDDGAVQFVISTGWLPQHATKNRIGYRGVGEWCSSMSNYFPSPSDLGFHSKTPRYDGHEPIDDSCEFCDGEPCYYDGSGLNAADAMYALVNGGEEALWEFLEAYYDCVFGTGTYPEPAEYPYAPRKKPAEIDKGGE